MNKKDSLKEKIVELEFQEQLIKGLQGISNSKKKKLAKVEENIETEKDIQEAEKLLKEA